MTHEEWRRNMVALVNAHHRLSGMRKFTSSLDELRELARDAEWDEPDARAFAVGVYRETLRGELEYLATDEATAILAALEVAP